MRLNRMVVIVCAAALAAASAAIALQPSTAPTTQSSRPRAVRLTTPWNKVADLTDEQKGKINAIHEETVDQIKALEKAEDDKCMALLTAEQKKTLDETLAKEAVEKKAKAGKKS